jgi:hypothetical protein
LRAGRSALPEDCPTRSRARLASDNRDSHGPLVLVPLILGVIFTISAVNTSGTQQDLSILIAAGLYLTAAVFLGVAVWVITHPLPDHDTPQTTETNRPENPDTGDASADRQQ